MRMPPELAVMGGNSDCRNRRLQTMFQLVGYGDHAGSGLPKIYRNWAGQHWRRPVLYEVREPEQTLMELRTSSLVPAEVVNELQEHLGDRFQALPELARLALITASTDGMVNNARLREISTEHPADITKILGGLVKDGMLSPAGSGRGMVYFLPWEKSYAGSLFDQAQPASGLIDPLTFPHQLSRIPQGLPSIPPELRSIPPELSALSEPVASYLDWQDVPQALQLLLLDIAKPVSERRRAASDLTQETVRKLCEGRYLGRRVLAHLLSRNADDLLKRTLNPMVADNILQTAHPSSSDPRQAYTAKPAGE
jgi:ATP-dependent DNA helicase RecG